MPSSSYSLSDHNLPSQLVIGGLLIKAARNLRRLLSAYALMWVALLAVVLGTTSCAKKVSVPDVTQQDVDQAAKTLAAMQLKMGTVSGLPSGSTQGAYVSSQNPPAGQQVTVDSVVDLVAVPPVLVPDLSKSNLTDAVNTLQSLGLRVSLMKQPTNNVFSRGHVKQQTPAANTPVRRDSTVTLMVEAPPKIGGLLGLVTKDPAYQKLDPQYRNVLDAFLRPPDPSAQPTGAATTPTTGGSSTPPVR